MSDADHPKGGKTFSVPAGTSEDRDRLRDSDRWLNAVLDNATVAIFLMDDRQQCVYMNRAAEQLTGYTLEETRGRPLHDVIHHTRPDGSHYPLEECAIDRAFPEHNRMQGEETFVHKDGSFYPVAYTASPIRDEEAKIVGTIIEVRDIREEKAAKRRQDLLIDELNHRVKNTLATVQSIAAQSFRTVGEDRSAWSVFEGRLVALSRAHDALVRDMWMGAPLQQIVEEAIEPFAEAGRNRFVIDGPPVQLTPKLALALAMGLHELCTNAAKYGALSNEAGHVEIKWMVRSTQERADLEFCWTERGGPTVTPPAEKGFGTRLIERALVREFGGTARLDFEPEGLACTLKMPLPADDTGMAGGLVAIHR